MLSFPLAVLDFEASSLGDERSYPIEAGLAIAASADAQIQVWSSLIKPTTEWSMHGEWSTKSARVHGITPRELETGLPPAEIAAELNQRLSGIPLVWCDGGEYDSHWLRRLFDGAWMRPTVRLCDLSLAFVLDRRRANRYAEAIGDAILAHRAAADAKRICSALIASGV